MAFISGYLGPRGQLPLCGAYALTFRQAANAENALELMAAGTAILLPVILGYTAWVWLGVPRKVAADAGTTEAPLWKRLAWFFGIAVTSTPATAAGRLWPGQVTDVFCYASPSLSAAATVTCPGHPHEPDCRLYLITPRPAGPGVRAPSGDAFSGGDVAALHPA